MVRKGHNSVPLLALGTLAQPFGKGMSAGGTDVVFSLFGHVYGAFRSLLFVEGGLKALVVFTYCHKYSSMSLCKR